jgi:hypothetical protein
MIRPCDMTGVWSRIAQALREPVRAEYEKLGIFKGGAGTTMLREKGYCESKSALKMSNTNLLGTERHQPRIVLFPEDEPSPSRTLLRETPKLVQYLIWARENMTGIGLVLRETVPKSASLSNSFPTEKYYSFLEQTPRPCTECNPRKSNGSRYDNYKNFKFHS